MKKVILILVLISSFSTWANTLTCRLVGGIPSTLILTKMVIDTNNTESTITFSSNKGEMKFDKVECTEEQTPDHMLSCEHDKFVAVISMDKPMQGAVNPFVYEGKEHGPYFYICSEK